MTAARRAYLQQLGGKGGAETVRRYGISYMRALGAAGFAAYCAAHHDGNTASALGALKQSKPRTFSRKG